MGAGSVSGGAAESRNRVRPTVGRLRAAGERGGGGGGGERLESTFLIRARRESRRRRWFGSAPRRFCMTMTRWRACACARCAAPLSFQSFVERRTRTRTGDWRVGQRSVAAVAVFFGRLRDCCCCSDSVPGCFFPASSLPMTEPRPGPKRSLLKCSWAFPPCHLSCH